MRWVAALLVLLLAGCSSTLPGTATPEPTHSVRGLDCDPLTLIHDTLAELGEDGTRWELERLDGVRGVAFSDRGRVRLEIHVDCAKGFAPGEPLT